MSILPPSFLAATRWIGGSILVGGNVNDAREIDNADDIKVVRPSARSLAVTVGGWLLDGVII